MARQQTKKLAADTTGLAEHPAFPAQRVTAYSALSSETGLSCLRRRAIISRDLASASGGQDHTPLPSASASLVRVPKGPRDTAASIASRAQRSWRSRNAPPERARDGAIMLLIIGKVKSNYEKQQCVTATDWRDGQLLRRIRRFIAMSMPGLSRSTGQVRLVLAVCLGNG